MKTNRLMKIIGTSIGVAAFTLSAYADKEITVVPKTKSLVVSSYPIVGWVHGGYAGQSFPVYTLGLIYQDKSTNSFYSSVTLTQRPKQKAIGLFQNTIVPDNDKNLEEAVNSNKIFCKADTLLQSAINEKSPIVLRLSDDQNEIKQINMYNEKFSFDGKFSK
jgi:hypothetical protein